jgi:hypothetical protein
VVGIDGPGGLISSGAVLLESTTDWGLRVPYLCVGDQPRRFEEGSCDEESSR